MSNAALVAEHATTDLINKSEIEHQIATARRFPRSIKKFRDEALQMVTLSESVAEQCVYALPRGGKTIEGPSARFAEIINSAWGNSRAGARVIDADASFVTAQGVFHDLERNTSITYEVKRRITDSRGRRYNDDMIGVTANAACSIALRNSILKGVPKAFWEDMYDAARQVTMGDVQTLANRRANALEAFQRFGITEEQVCAKIGVAGIEDIGLEHLVTLRGLLTAIKEGDTTPEDAFAAPKEPADTKKDDDFARSMAQRKADAARKPDSEPESVPGPAARAEPATESKDPGAERADDSPPPAAGEPASGSTRPRRRRGVIE